LLDSGDDGNYQNNTNSTITIAPAGATSVTLNFISFNFQSGSDYLYIYDGMDDTSPLIGQYTGTDLPNGGTITSTYGYVTIKQTSNGWTTRDGFELTWSCNYPTTPPVPDFTSSTISTCTGIVDFTDLSTNGAESWMWEFGDGDTSIDQNPSHVYTSSGLYSVTLTATNSIGSDSEIKTDLISVNLPDAPTVLGDSTCGEGSVDLSATGTGSLEWYDVATGGTLINTGATYTTTVISSSTTYYVENVETSTDTYYVGSTDNTANGELHNGGFYLEFDCFTPFVLKSVEVNADSDGDVSIDLVDDSGTAIESVTVFASAGVSRIDVNLNIPVGTDLGLELTSNGDLYRNNSNTNYPYEEPGVLSITGSTAGTAYYYYFYDW